VFLGYSNIHKGFKCLDVADDRVYISCDVVFDETVFPFSKLNLLILILNLLIPTHSQPHTIPSHGIELLGDEYSNVLVNPDSTNSTTPCGWCKKFDLI
jgi:hypothetical protein